MSEQSQMRSRNLEIRLKRQKEKEMNLQFNIKCEKQFPDCPEEPNKEDCKLCPFRRRNV